MTKIKTLTIPNVGKDMKILEFSFVDGESIKWYDHLGKQFGYYKVKYIPI